MIGDEEYVHREVCVNIFVYYFFEVYFLRRLECLKRK